MNMHELDSAIRDYETAVRVDSNNDINRIYLTQALFKTGRYDEAVDGENNSARTHWEKDSREVLVTSVSNHDVWLMAGSLKAQILTTIGEI